MLPNTVYPVRPYLQGKEHPITSSAESLRSNNGLVKKIHKEVHYSSTSSAESLRSNNGLLKKIHKEVRHSSTRTLQSSFAFIRDKYTEARGEPQMLEITCIKCHQWLMDYQKDGPGELLRCYVDRIYHPRRLEEKIFDEKTIGKIRPLKCSKCDSIWATPMIYQRKGPPPEKRAAYRIVKNGEGWMIHKQLRKR